MTWRFNNRAFHTFIYICTVIRHYRTVPFIIWLLNVNDITTNSPVMRQNVQRQTRRSMRDIYCVITRFSRGLQHLLGHSENSLNIPRHRVYARFSFCQRCWRILSVSLQTKSAYRVKLFESHLIGEKISIKHINSKKFLKILFLSKNRKRLFYVLG